MSDPIILRCKGCNRIAGILIKGRFDKNSSIFCKRCNKAREEMIAIAEFYMTKQNMDELLKKFKDVKFDRVSGRIDEKEESYTKKLFDKLSKMKWWY